MPSIILGDGSLRGIASSNRVVGDHFLFVTPSSGILRPSISVISTNSTQLLLPAKNDVYDLSYVFEVLQPLGFPKFQSIILRNYIEVGNFFLTDIFHQSSLNYSVLGDTHHIPSSLEWCLKVLLKVRPALFYSRSNPHHALLLHHILLDNFNLNIPFCSAPDYLLVDPSLCAQSNSSVDNSALLCVSNLKVQSGRRRLLLRILKSTSLLSNFYFFNFTASEESFRHLLSSHTHLVIPSINGQISPQIFYGISHKCLPIVDSHSILSLTPFTHTIVSDLPRINDILPPSSLSFVNTKCFDHFIDLSAQFLSIASSEIEFVRSILSHDSLFTSFFIPILPLFHPRSLYNESQFCYDYNYVITLLDKAKLLALLDNNDPNQLDYISDQLLHISTTPSVHSLIRLSLEAICHSRSWLYNK